MTYRVAIATQKGHKVFTLQTLPLQPESLPENARMAKPNGFNLHVGVAARAHQSNNVELLCRCIARPTIAERAHRKCKRYLRTWAISRCVNDRRQQFAGIREYRFKSSEDPRIYNSG